MYRIIAHQSSTNKVMVILPLTDLYEYDADTPCSETNVPVVDTQTSQSQVVTANEPVYFAMNEVIGMSDLDEEVIVNSDN